MSAKTAAVLTPAVLELALDQIEEDPNNARITFDEARIADVSASLKDQGQLYPIIVRRVGDKYRLVDGARRFRAAPAAGLKTLRAEVRELTDAEAALAAATANLQRENLTEYEEARAFQQLLDLGQKVADIARLRGVAHNTVKNRLQLLKLPEAVARRVGQDGFLIGHAQALLPYAGQPKLLEAATAFVAEVKTKDLGHVEDFAGDVEDALAKQKLVARETDVERYWNLNLSKHTAKVPQVEVDGNTLYTDVAAFDEAVAAARKEAASKQSQPRAESPQKVNEAKRREARALELARNKQVELLEAHVSKSLKWNDDLLRELILGFLHHASRPSRNDDIEACARATGLTAEQERLLTLDWEARENPEKVRKLFKDSRDKIVKLVATRLFFDRQAHDGITVGSRYLNVPHVAAPKDKLLTGKAYADVLDEATAAVKLEAEAKNAKKKGKAPAGKPDKKPKAPPAPAAKAKGKAKQTKGSKAAKKPVKDTPAVAKAKAKLAAKRSQQASLPKAAGLDPAVEQRFDIIHVAVDDLPAEHVAAEPQA